MRRQVLSFFFLPKVDPYKYGLEHPRNTGASSRFHPSVRKWAATWFDFIRILTVPK